MFDFMQYKYLNKFIIVLNFYSNSHGKINK